MIDRDDQKLWMDFLPYSIGELQQRVDDICSTSWACTSIKIEQHNRDGFWELEAGLIGSGTHTQEHARAILQFFLWHESGRIYPLPGLHLPGFMIATLNHLAACTHERPMYKIDDSIFCNIYSDNFNKRIAEKRDEFIWERIYPGTCFAPLGGFMNHMARYRIALDFFGNNVRDILDLGCGVGYGSKYLATYLPEARVSGVDNDAHTITDAMEIYGGDNNFWILDDAEGLGNFESDGICCFELLEHMRDPHHLLSTISRLLKPGGLALISTPNGESDSRRNIRNPYHTKEYKYDEFNSLLCQHFDQVKIAGALRNDDVTQPNRYQSNFVEQTPMIEGFMALCQ